MACVPFKAWRPLVVYRRCFRCLPRSRAVCCSLLAFDSGKTWAWNRGKAAEEEEEEEDEETEEEEEEEACSIGAQTTPSVSNACELGSGDLVMQSPEHRRDTSRMREVDSTRWARIQCNVNLGGCLDLEQEQTEKRRKC